MIAAGACIGSGIFISPSDVASQLTSGSEVLLVWLIGGVVTITGALTFGELAGRYPGTGGVYIYLREAYGNLAAFLYGWCSLTVITSGAIAALCLAFARYFEIIFHTRGQLQIPIGLSMLFIVTLINLRGARLSAIFSGSITVMKVIGIGVIIIMCFLLGQQFIPNLANTGPDNAVVNFGIALVGVLWSYGGWHHASYVSGEVNNARKVVPRALLLGGIIVTTAYVLVNAAYLSVMSTQEIGASKAVASDALERVLPVGGLLVAILITLSVFGTAGIFTLSAPRLYFKMGEDKIFFSWLGEVQANTGVPVKAILLQSGWAALLMIFWGTFESLATYVVFMDWIFMTMAAIAIFLFRKRQGIDHENYKVPLYPLIPLIFICISVWFLVSTIIGRPEQAIAGILLLVIGLPVFYWFKNSNASKNN